jgi:dolichol-phosphate mannosyltransferase
MSKLKLSIVIPAYNEEDNIDHVLKSLTSTLESNSITYEIIVVNDNSTDSTSTIVSTFSEGNPAIRLVNRQPPVGFGRAIRFGLRFVTGEMVVICMADQSDDAQDVVAYYHKIMEGYDCVFGSRFIPGADVHEYPRIKLIFNRIVNKTIQILFWTGHNDMTNAFKAYRTYVIRECGPYNACHFNITIEMSLSALIRGYTIAKIPIRWYGRAWGSSKLRLKEMSRRYLVTLLKLFFDKLLISDDLIAERISHILHAERFSPELYDRMTTVEKKVEAIEERIGL